MRWKDTTMDMNGEYQIAAPRQRVWEALNDPEVLRQCIPGCEEIVKESALAWTAKVTAKVGPVKAKFAGKVTLSDLDPPNGYTTTGESTGGAAGFAQGGAAGKPPHPRGRPPPPPPPPPPRRRPPPPHPS